MIRTTGANHSNNLFTDGPPGTTIEALWLNNVQEEIISVIEAETIPLDANNTGQLLEALDSRYILSTGTVSFPSAGTAALPGWYFVNDADTGGWSSGANILNWSTNGVERMELSNTEMKLGAGVIFRITELGTEALPCITPVGNPGTGIWFSAVDKINISTAGEEIIEIDSNSLNLNKCTIESDSSAATVYLRTWNTSSTATSTIYLQRSDSNIIGTDTVTADNDFLGAIYWEGNDGSGHTTAAYIRVDQDGAAGALTPAEMLFFISNGATAPEVLRLTSGGALSTGGESAPDVDAGGLCLNHGANDGNVLSFKNSDIAHGITDFAETDTYFSAKKFNATTGGTVLTGYSEDEQGFAIQGASTNANSTISTAGVAAVTVDSYKKSGTSLTGFGGTENIFIVRNGGNTKFLVQGDGHLYTDSAGGAGGSGDATVRYYDDEDDIMLAEAARYAIGNKEWKNNIMEKHGKRLEELGIMKKGFMWHQGIDALNLGAIGQLWNIIRHVSKNLNLTEKQLLDYAKNYE